MSSHLARLEALLFVAGEDGLSLRTMAQLLAMPVTGLTQSLEKLQAKYGQMRIQLFVYWSPQIPTS